MSKRIRTLPDLWLYVAEVFHSRELAKDPSPRYYGGICLVLSQIHADGLISRARLEGALAQLIEVFGGRDPYPSGNVARYRSPKTLWWGRSDTERGSAYRVWASLFLWEHSR